MTHHVCILNFDEIPRGVTVTEFLEPKRIAKSLGYVTYNSFDYREVYVVFDDELDALEFKLKFL
jgi:hypothetical protein